MSSDQLKSKVDHRGGSVSRSMSEPAVQEPSEQSNDDATIQTVAKLPHESPSQTETNLTEQSPSRLPSWTVQGYKVSTEVYYRNSSELMNVASLAILAENANFRT